MGNVNDYEALVSERMNLKKEAADLIRQITARKAALRAYNLTKNADKKLMEMALRQAQINARLQYIKIALKEITPPQPVKPAQSEPPCRRPDGCGTEINPHGMFQTMNGWERRLLGLMIAEIGDDRYKELKKLAAYDVKHKTFGSAPRYSTWTSEPPQDVNEVADGLAWESLPERPEPKAPVKLKPVREDREFEKIDRMMRNNYNKWF